MSLTPNQVAALRELEEIWPRRATAIIGATALGFYYDMTWRKTADVDLVVAIDFGEFPGVITKRLEGMDLAFGHAEIHDVEGGFVVNVAPPAVIHRAQDGVLL